MARPGTPLGKTEPLGEHPEGEEIRRQVEFYFSDGNLATDNHLLGLCGGRENLPVSISQILGFKKMRRFRPKTRVVESLRKSDFLEVDETGKTIKRKIAIRIPTLLDDDDDDSELAYDPASAQEERKATPRRAKQVVPTTLRKEVPPGMTKNMMKPSGFEEYYVEGPLTPDQYEEEKQMYDPDISFVERIEVAIQRFKAKRKMHQMFVEVFSKFMRFGGVDGQQRQFTGRLAKTELEEYDASEIARMMATHHVPWDRADPKRWTVDFEGVAKGFLSSYYPQYFSPEIRQINRTTQVLRSFYNYILLHNVCPEFNDDILAARRICDLADKELPAVYAVGPLLPGTFNTCASALLGGYWTQIHPPNQNPDKSWDHASRDSSWAGEIPDATSKQTYRPEAMLAAFKLGVLACGSEAAYNALTTGGQDISTIKAAFPVLGSETVGLSVLGTEPPSDDTRALYAAHNKKWSHKLQIEPLGKLICDAWAVPDLEEWDLPPHLLAEKKKARPRRFEFWIEESALKLCFANMKIRATVMKLEHEIEVLDEVQLVHCSFYEFLLNELQMQAKVPKEVRFLKHRDLKAMEEWEAEEKAVAEV
ncbi:hypothetical protein BU16DRAFT_467767 [Lophium mytilinum]|uniref:HTH La-type RNA-binding domain-containing protein n=1 Tax=Lophium mytilinum TaxID=390894 RepID=A0A6A6QIE6_9PEZI|nr:hypothetical protein BU16DRAFT_467767 [Lophium mytilinum]